ncbi:MAG: dicarboxylate/amino acid:cation symporter, partial [Brachybacterium sp.]|uniref:cation:dicarboxylate symporter family transporter n=1 Tax=Brachybacterium sp. TaxID=1891286 RepID=UPI00264A174C
MNTAARSVAADRTDEGPEADPAQDAPAAQGRQVGPDAPDGPGTPDGSEAAARRRSRFGLLPRIVLAIALGILLGLVLPESIARVFTTFNGLFSGFLGFLIPLIIVGLVTPAIAELGHGAGKMLAATAGIAYLSTALCGAIMAAAGVLSSILGFGEAAVGLMIAAYIAIDSSGTATNVTGDGAIAAVTTAPRRLRGLPGPGP